MIVVKAFSNRPLRFGAACCVLLVTLAGCGFDNSLELGPFAVDVSAGEGTISATAFLPLKDGLYRAVEEREYCTLPTEEEASTYVRMVGKLDFGDFIQLSRLELKNITITATSGDLSFATEVAVRYIPAPVDGETQEAVVIGAANAPEGFGDSIVLAPPDYVDFLDLIQANDANPTAECPTLEVEVTGLSIPLQDIHYQAEAHLDAYATASLF